MGPQDCARSLSRHRVRTQAQWLRRLGELASAADGPLDVYGEGESLQRLESEVASLLGKPRGRFVIKGVIAQQAILRAWTERSGSPVVALHSQSHIAGDEDDGYQLLHGLRPAKLASWQPFTAADLDAVHERIGAVVVELPIRRAGNRLPSWTELAGISQWCKEKGVPLHFDGARLWECAPHYGRPVAEIAALADSVYVSFYKTLGGLAGCVLAGGEEVLAETVPWTSRHGANVNTVFPYVLAAFDGLRTHLPAIEGYCARARALASTVDAIPEVTASPNPPHTNAFGVFLPGTPEALTAANEKVAKETGVWLFDAFRETPLPGRSQAEIIVGDATADIGDGEAAELIRALVASAGAA